MHRLSRHRRSENLRAFGPRVLKRTGLPGRAAGAADALSGAAVEKGWHPGATEVVRRPLPGWSSRVCVGTNRDSQRCLRRRRLESRTDQKSAALCECPDVTKYRGGSLSVCTTTLSPPFAPRCRQSLVHPPLLRTGLGGVKSKPSSHGAWRPNLWSAPRRTLGGRAKKGAARRSLGFPYPSPNAECHRPLQGTTDPDAHRRLTASSVGPIMLWCQVEGDARAESSPYAPVAWSLPLSRS